MRYQTMGEAAPVNCGVCFELFNEIASVPFDNLAITKKWGAVFKSPLPPFTKGGFSISDWLIKS